MKTVLLTLGLLLGLVSAAAAQATFDCSGGFATSGECGLNLTWEYKGTPFKFIGADAVKPKLEGTSLLLYPTGSSHLVANLIYQKKVSVKAFTTKFVFVPNGLTLAFNFNNTTNVPGYQGADFAQGAGCEAGFFQGYTPQIEPANHVFAMDFDSFSGLKPYQNSPWDFTYSSVQIYQSNLPESEHPNSLVQCPCTGGSTVCGNNTNPNVGDHQVAKLSTAPVPLDNPANAAYTTTGDTYSATVNYDGSNLNLDLADTTKGGPHFTHTWSTDIPHSVDADTAWVGLVATSSGASEHPLYVKSWTYGAGGSGPGPTPAPTNTPEPEPTSTSIPPAADNCQFTSPLGTVTWPCSAAD